MAETNVRDMLISYLRDCHAMEENMIRMLDSMIVTTKDPEIRQALETHRTETESHERLIQQRLEEMNAEMTQLKDIPATLMALAKGVADAVRTDKPGKNARDGYVAEAMEIAAYNLLEQLAERAGDQVTVNLATRIRADEERMRDIIDGSWGKVIDLTLQEEGIRA